MEYNKKEIQRRTFQNKVRGKDEIAGIYVICLGQWTEYYGADSVEASHHVTLMSPPSKKKPKDCNIKVSSTPRLHNQNVVQ